MSDDDPKNAFEGEFTLIRKKFATPLLWAFFAILVFVGLFNLMMFGLIVFGGRETLDTMALVSTLQVGLGMVLGLVCVFMGLVVVWLSISAAESKVDAKGATAALNIQTASPGLVFFVGGVILIGMSLYKPLTYEKKPETIGRVPFSMIGKEPPPMPIERPAKTESP